jgi:hypothetical protein
MKKSTRALLGMVVLDGIFLAGTAWFVWMVMSGASKTTIPREEAIVQITQMGGGLIGFVTVVLAIAWYVHRRNGN